MQETEIHPSIFHVLILDGVTEDLGTVQRKTGHKNHGAYATGGGSVEMEEEVPPLFLRLDYETSDFEITQQYSFIVIQKHIFSLLWKTSLL